MFSIQKLIFKMPSIDIIISKLLINIISFDQPVSLLVII